MWAAQTCHYVPLFLPVHKWVNLKSAQFSVWRGRCPSGEASELRGTPSPACRKVHPGMRVGKRCHQEAACDRPVCCPVAHEAEAVEIFFLDPLERYTEALGCRSLTGNDCLHALINTCYLSQMVQPSAFAIHPLQGHIDVLVDEVIGNAVLRMRHEAKPAPMCSLRMRHEGRCVAILEPPPSVLWRAPQLQAMACRQITNILQHADIVGAGQCGPETRLTARAAQSRLQHAGRGQGRQWLPIIIASAVPRVSALISSAGVATITVVTG